MKHALAREASVNIDAIKPAHQITCGVPDLHAMRVAQPVQFAISAQHRRCNPRARFTRAPDVCAVSDYVPEVFINRASQSGAPAHPLQAARHMKVFELKYRPFFGAE